MKKLLLPLLVIVVLLGAYIAFNKQPGIPDDLSDGGGEPTNETPSGDETQEDEPDAPPTLEKGLKGVSLSPRDYSESGFPDFLEKASSSGDLITWVGDWIQLSTPNSSPYVVYALRGNYDYEAMVITAYIEQSSGTLLRPLDEETKQLYIESASSFAATYKPRYIGFGVEMNIIIQSNPEAYYEFKEFYPLVYAAVKEASPETLVFTVWQLEQMKGLDGGFFGGINDPANAQWDLLNDFETDIAAFTLYPCLIYDDPADIPDDYLTEITEYTDQPIAFTEMGWFRDGYPGWESSSEEQATFIDRYFELSEPIDPVFTIWSFYTIRIPSSPSTPWGYWMST